jgi:hypothetical protein
MPLRPRNRWIVLAAVAVLGAVAVSVAVPPWTWQAGREWAADGVFLVKPYVQWGPSPRPGASGGIEILWQGADREERFAVEVRTSASSESESEGAWVAAGSPVWRRVAVEGVAPRRFYRAGLGAAGGVPGSTCRYRITYGGTPVFKSQVRIPRIKSDPHRFVVFGDGGADTAAQREVAYQTYLARPDIVMITGDITYYKGSLTEYLHHFFPVYNSDRASPTAGAPLLRETLLLAAAGNHDLIGRDLDRCPDGLAYYLLWSLPMNGPLAAPGAASTPILRGATARQRAFVEAAGPAYPRMANYAFDHGGAHWTVLDTNAHADWTEPALRDWLARDLGSEAARKADWRFIAFHQPPFHSAREHAEEQHSRVLTELFEQAGVDIVFCGHIHHYERTYPMRFTAARTADGKAIAVAADGRIPGRWTLDRAFDGITRTRPDGVIYVVSGGGGARLYSREWHGDPSSWQEFTARYVANVHSLTVVDVTAQRLTLRQVSAVGEELDRFVVTRAP